MPPFAIAASGTDIGKTHVACLIARALRREGQRVRALKPVASGIDPEALADSDAGKLLAACGRTVDDTTIAAISPWRFAAPASPHLAAEKEGRRIDPEALLAWCREQLAAARREPHAVIVETAGGVMTPLTPKAGMREWLAALDLPVLLVCGTALGDISHGLTARHALESAGVTLLGIVVNESTSPGATLAETAEALSGWSGQPLRCFPVPRLTLDETGALPHAAGDAVGDALLAWLREER